jgi:hypothetical protein
MFVWALHTGTNTHKQINREVIEIVTLVKQNNSLKIVTRTGDENNELSWVWKGHHLSL